MEFGGLLFSGTTEEEMLEAVMRGCYKVGRETQECSWKQQNEWKDLKHYEYMFSRIVLKSAFLVPIIFPVCYWLINVNTLSVEAPFLNWTTFCWGQ